MSPEKEKKYMEIRERVRDLYKHTDMSVTAVASHFDISWGKANNMIMENGEPKFVEKYLKEGSMKVTTGDINYTKDLRLDEALHYVRQTLIDVQKMDISIQWRFDEQQADGFHRSWTGDRFIKNIERIVFNYPFGK